MKKKKLADLPPDLEITLGPDGQKYQDYLKEQKKQLRRLEREATGRNMSEPPDGDY